MLPFRHDSQRHLVIRLFVIALLMPILFTQPVLAQTTTKATEISAAQRQKLMQTAQHLRLKNNLDRPDDGYCLDILGSGDYVRFDLPMTTHNCKPGLYADEALVHDPQGRLYFPAYDICATVAGLNGRALTGAAVLARPCDERSPFMEAAALQKFDIHPDGRVELRGSGLCLTAGSTSASTFEATHRWRSLYVSDCQTAEPTLSQWYFNKPVQN